MADTLLASRPAAPVVRGVAAALEHLPRRRPSLALLTYHRVAPADERPDLHPGLRVDPEAFADQVRLVAERAHPVSLADIEAARTGGPPLPARAVHITIDDAYACVEEHAWPTLRAAGVPATLFVPTDHPGSDLTFWWDRLHHALRATRHPAVRVGDRAWATDGPVARAAAFAALRREVVARDHDSGMALVDAVVAAAEVRPARPATSSWAALRRMGAEGLALAPHSRSHPRLDRVGADRLDDEVAGSWDALRAAVGPLAHRAFAPPGGGCDDAVRAATRRAGLPLVMTTARGVNRGDRPDWEDLRRINVGPQASTGLVRIQLSPEVHAARAGAARVRTRAPGHRAAHGGRSWS